MGSRIPQILFLAGIFLLILSLITGEGKGGIFIIFPFFYGTGILSITGMLLIFLSFAAFIFSLPQRIDGDVLQMGDRKTKAGGIIFIGPIPIVFSGDEGMGKILAALAVIIAFLILAIFIITLLFPF